MLTKIGGGVFILGFILLVACASVYGQQKVYKWVDEDGVVHFSEEPPRDSVEGKVETLTTDPAPRYVPPARPTIESPSNARSTDERKRVEPEPEVRRPAPVLDITKMSLEDLDRRCEEAREKKIAPLREAEIAKCLETETGDLAWCETFWADYGDARRTASGYFVPRMFHDLPECLQAWEERNRR
jgi:hypothetical protein